MSIGELEVRPHERTVVVHGVEVPLTSREFEIVMMLAEHPGWVFSADQLSSDSSQGERSPESVSVHVSRLRRKLAEAGAPDSIETVRGFGYRLCQDAEECGPYTPAGANRELRDALWQLTEAVFEMEYSGTREQQDAACETLDGARRTIYGSLGE